MSKRITALLAATVVFAACGDAEGPGDVMTRTEALLISSALTAQGESTATASEPETGEVSIASVPTTFTQDHTSSHPCPQGGHLALSYRVTGAFDNSVGSWEIDLAGKQTHMSCAYSLQGLTITVHGRPEINFDARAAVYNGAPSEPATLGIDGSFRWTASDGREGTCQIEVNAITDFAAKRKTVNGAVCGHTIQEITTWS
jgi:hypothetical protein